MQLVGPRYEARATISARAAPAAAPSPSWIGTVVAAPAFADAVAGRLGEGPRGETAFSLPRRVADLIEGRPLYETVRRQGGRGLAESVSVERGGAPGELSVVSLAGTPEEAQDLTNAVAAELVARIGGDEPVAGRDEAQLRVLHERVAGLRRRLADLADDPDRTSLEAEASELERSGAQLEDALEEAEERLSVLRALAADPASAVPGEAIADEALEEAVEAHRRLTASIDNLSLTLLEGHPRLRIARLRLADLAAGIAERAQAQMQTTAAALEAMRLRLSETEDRRDRLGERLRDAEAAVEARAELGRELAAVENELAIAERDPIPAPPSPRASVVAMAEAGSVREAPVPILPVTAVAALCGLLVGGVASALASAAARPRTTRDRPERDRSPARPIETQEMPVAPPAAPVLDAPPDAAPADGPPAGIALADVAAALLTSPVSRTLVVAAGESGDAPLSLTLARALADADKLVLLFDLSPGQEAARRAGVPSAHVGFGEVARGAVGLASATIVDEASAADIVGAGTGLESSAGTSGGATLDFARRAYDHILVDCGTLPASEIVALADEECAVLIEAAGGGELDERLAELAGAGLDTVIIVLA